MVTFIKRLAIYVAGPYSPSSTTLIHDAARVAHQNTMRAITVGLDIIKKGHYPYIPHLSHFIHLNAEKDYGDFYYECDNIWLDKCDALFYMGPSIGADAELQRASMANKPIFYTLDEVPIIRR